MLPSSGASALLRIFAPFAVLDRIGFFNREKRERTQKPNHRAQSLLTQRSRRPRKERKGACRRMRSQHTSLVTECLIAEISVILTGAFDWVRRCRKGHVPLAHLPFRRLGRSPNHSAILSIISAIKHSAATCRSLFLVCPEGIPPASRPPACCRTAPRSLRRSFAPLRSKIPRFEPSRNFAIFAVKNGSDFFNREDRAHAIA